MHGAAPGQSEGVFIATQDAPDRSESTLVLLAAAAGLEIANLYYAQPLAAAIARDFHTTASGVSSALVGTQLGYAAGMLLLVPLGDVRERRGDRARRYLRPHIAARSKWARIEALLRNRAFTMEYASAREPMAR